MAQRLSMFTDLRSTRCRIRRAGARTRRGPTFLFAQAYHAALNYGDPAGAAFLAVSQPVVDAQRPARAADAGRPPRC